MVSSHGLETSQQIEAAIVLPTMRSVLLLVLVTMSVKSQMKECGIVLCRSWKYSTRLWWLRYVVHAEQMDLSLGSPTSVSYPTLLQSSILDHPDPVP